MIELAVVGGLLALFASAAAAAFVPWDVLLDAGYWLCGVGFALGVPTGVVYHVLLYRALKPRDELPHGWIWRPLELNDRLRPGERRRVLAWAWIGGAGFGVIVLGFVAIALSIVSVVTRGV